MAHAVDDGFARFAELFSEPLLLVTTAGELRAANSAARRELLADLRGASIAELVSDSVDKVHEYLRLCSRTAQKLPGAFTFRASQRKYHCEGSAWSNDDDRLVFLRISATAESLGRFAALNRQIQDLKREITRRLHAERELAEQRELLRVTLSSIGDAVLATDEQGITTFLNPVAERLTGWSAVEARGRPLDEVFVIRNEVTGEPVESPASKVLRDGHVVGLANHTVLIRRGDGAETAIDDSGAPIRDSSGELHGVVMVFHEITERRRLERELERQAAELKEADRRKDQFLAMLAHELRNPLAPLHNAVQLLRRQGHAADLERLTGMMERQTAQLTRLVDDLLDLARITRGAIPLEREPVAVLRVLEHAIETARPLIDERGHRLAFTPPPATLVVDGDLARLSQVFCNLLNNAAKFMDPGGEITVGATAVDGRAVITVRDRGRGMAPEFLARVFELFSQEDRSLDRRQGGLGIGLTLVKTLVDRHGGEVSARSEGSGKGTEFRVALPLVEPPRVPAVSAGPPEQRADLRVLIVDDNLDAAESLRMLLEVWGCAVDVAADGAAAIDRVRESSPALVLLDIGLPGVDGYEAARRMRLLPGGDALRIVAVTGYGSDVDRRRAEEAGFDDHLTKPVDLAKLRALLAAPRRVRSGGAGLDPDGAGTRE